MFKWKVNKKKSIAQSEHIIYYYCLDAHQTKANSTTGTTENNNGVVKSATESEEEGEVKSIHSQQSPNIKEEVETQNETKESSSSYEDALEDGEIAE